MRRLPPLPLLRRVFTLPPGERRDLWRAQWFILKAHFRLRSQPEGRLMEDWRPPAPTEPRRLRPAELDRAIEVGHAVRRVGRYGLTRPLCLARSLAITEMLEHEGIAGSMIRVGVRPGRGSLKAHAWVELGGHVIGDTERHVRRFVEFVSTTPAPR